jgi:hypothetical protein
MMLSVKLSKKTFNKLLWAEQREERKQMISSLINSEILIGLTKTEVLEILGFEFNDANSDTWSYYIGTKTFFSFKMHLFLYFNAQGKVFRIVKK